MTDVDPSNTIPTPDGRETTPADPTQTPESAEGPAPGAAPGAPGAQLPADDGAVPGDAHNAPELVPGAGVRYAVLRLLMLVAVGGILYLVGMRGWALLFAAVLVSAIASWFVFMRQREAAARGLEARFAARRHPENPAAPGSGAPAGSDD